MTLIIRVFSGYPSKKPKEELKSANFYNSDPVNNKTHCQHRNSNMRLYYLVFAALFMISGASAQNPFGNMLNNLTKGMEEVTKDLQRRQESSPGTIKKPSPGTIKKPSPGTIKKPSPRITKRNTRASSPKTSNDEKILGSRYEQYIFIKECNIISTRYISRNELKTAKSKIASIQKYYKKKNKRMNTDTVWESASNNWEKEYRGSFRMYKSFGRWNKDLNGLCRLQFMGLSSVEIPGAKKKKRKRDF